MSVYIRQVLVSQLFGCLLFAFVISFAFQQSRYLLEVMIRLDQCLCLCQFYHKTTRHTLSASMSEITSAPSVLDAILTFSPFQLDDLLKLAVLLCPILELLLMLMIFQLQKETTAAGTQKPSVI